jgi:PDZ domain
MVDKINGMTINQLSDVPKAFAATTGPDAIVEFLPDHHFEVIRKDDAEKANPDILDTYRVPAQSRL